MSPKRKAVVSGLGPNGVLAALELLNCGYQVTVIEKRPSYTRPIHLHLRASYLEDVGRLSPDLLAKVMEISTPIEENSRVRHLPPGPVPNHLKRWMNSFRSFFQATPSKSQALEEYPVRSRLMTTPLRHMRLDSAERLFFAHLDQLAQKSSHPVTICRGYFLNLEPDSNGRYRASIRDVKDAKPREDLGCPDLVVLAEGGKSTSVRKLGLESVRFSYPKYFMSAHADVVFGPRTSRIDTNVPQLLSNSAPPDEVSLWASGHGNPKEGTWIVIEVPEALLNQSPQDAERYFLEGALLLLAGDQPHQRDELRQKIAQALKKSDILKNTRGSSLSAVDGPENTPFAGTFKFEQQCLRYPAAGQNVVVLGDAAGMGHHALSSGLEMGACDLAPLGLLAHQLAENQDPNACISRYAEAVFRSRITLLALGMREYYPNLLDDPIHEMHRVAELFGTDLS